MDNLIFQQIDFVGDIIKFVTRPEYLIYGKVRERNYKRVCCSRLKAYLEKKFEGLHFDIIICVFGICFFAMIKIRDEQQRDFFEVLRQQILASLKNRIEDFLDGESIHFEGVAYPFGSFHRWNVNLLFVMVLERKIKGKKVFEEEHKEAQEEGIISFSQMKAYVRDLKFL